MSDSEIFDLPQKVNKPKKGMSEERRAMLLANLKKGRETSKKNRAKKKFAKEIIKRKKNDVIDDTIREEVLRQEKEKKSYNQLEQELKELKARLNKQPKIRETPTGGDNKEDIERIKIEPKLKKEKPQDDYVVGRHYSNKDLITVKDTEKEVNFSTFKSMWD